MKQFLKLTIALILGMVALGFQSCGSDDDEPDAKIKVTQTEIQGKWHNATYGSYHHFTFDGNKYSYSRMDVRTSNIEYMEAGTYTLSGTEISFKSSIGSSQIGGTGECEIYWENGNKSQLHIYPLGAFDRAD